MPETPIRHSVSHELALEFHDSNHYIGDHTHDAETCEACVLLRAVEGLEEQLRTLEFAAIRLCNMHRWSYGGPETLVALADRIAGHA